MENARVWYQVGTNKVERLVYLAAVAPGVAVAVLVLTLVVEAVDLGIRVNVQIELSASPNGVFLPIRGFHSTSLLAG